MPVNNAMKMPIGSDSTPRTRACMLNSGIQSFVSRIARNVATTNRVPAPI